MPAAAILALALAVGCAPREPAPEQPPPSRGVRRVVLRSGSTDARPGVPVVRVEVAATPDERRRGLGGRTSLPPDGGMLFVYVEDAPREFWMKDCAIGLDIAFLDASRRIVHVATLPPGAGLPDDRVPRVRCEAPARYVLETEAGWFARHAVAAGDAADLDAALAGVEPR